jgi:subtilisin family serine protease
MRPKLRFLIVSLIFLILAGLMGLQTHRSNGKHDSARDKTSTPSQQTGNNAITPPGTRASSSTPAVSLADSESKKKLTDTSQLIDQREMPDPGNAQRTLRSSLMRSDFKYPMIRCDEVWEGSKRLSQMFYVADHVLVQFPAGYTQQTIKNWAESHHFTLRHQLKTGAIYLIATETPSLDSTSLLIDQINRDFPSNEVKVTAEKDYLVFASVTPNDTSYDQLWGMNNTGQTGGTNDADIDAPEAWNFSHGSSQTWVAVIDSGVDATHTDLQANIATNSAEIAGNGIDDDHNGFVDDVHGWDFYNDDKDPADDNSHGTHCSGTIGAIGNNGTGVVGVCWQVSILPVKFLGASGSGSTSDAIDAVNYATTMHVTLSSNSWGGGGYSSLLETAISNANTNGVLFVAAAGNDSSDTDTTTNYPSCYNLPNVISVAATTASDTLAYFSNYGLSTVDLGAPGYLIYSTIPSQSYGTKSGTSMATPHVSGALALMRSLAPQMNHLALKQLLFDSVDPIPALQGITVTGGRLNVARAVSQLAGPQITTTSSVHITSGNSDAYLNPGEQGEFAFTFQNIGTETANNVTASISPDAVYAGIHLSSTSFSLGSLAAGATSAEYKVAFTVDADTATPTHGSYTLTLHDDAQHTWTSNPSLDVYNSTIVEGRVTAAVTGEVIPSAIVTWSGPTNGSTTADAAGNFSFLAVNGSYTINCSATGYVSTGAVTISTPPAPSSIELKLGIPSLTATPSAIHENIASGNATTVTISLSNQGTAAVTWTAASSNSSAQIASNIQGNADLTNIVVGIIGGTSTFADELASRGATIQPLYFPLSSTDFDDLDVLIIDDAVGDANSTDIEWIRNWVSEGGGLFLCGDDSASMSAINSLLEGSGIQETSFNDYYYNTISNIHPHSTTVGVSSLYLSSYGSMCTVSGSASPLFSDPSERLIAAGSESGTGTGRIIALGNEIDSSIDSADGLLFCNQAIDWLVMNQLWLKPSGAESGTIQPGETASLTLQIDAKNLYAGNYSGSITIKSNDPSHPEISIPVSISVSGAPALAATPGSLSFPDTYRQSQNSLNLKLSNTGTEVTTITSIRFDRADFSSTISAPVSVEPGKTLTMPVTFTPASSGSITGNLTILSNASNAPTLTIPLSGSGLIPPSLNLSPSSITTTLAHKETQSRTVTISNSGGSSMQWSLAISNGPLSWLTPSATSGTIAAGGTQNLNLNFAAGSLSAGTYTTTLTVSSNDPQTPTITVPVTMTISPGPLIEVTPNPLAFGSVPSNSSAQLPLLIRNLGEQQLILSGASLSTGTKFNVSNQGSLAIDPGASTGLFITYTPTSTGTDSDVIILQSNSAGTPSLSIPVSGTSTTANTITAAPKKIDVTLEAGKSSSTVLTLQNNGSTSATWQAFSRSITNQASTSLKGVSVLMIGSSSNSILQSTLESLGASVQFISYTSVSTSVLANYKVAVIDYNVEYLSTTSMSALSSWLSAGGSLMISGTYSYTNHNTLLSTYGITKIYNYSYNLNPWTTTDKSYLTSGISQFSHDSSIYTWLSTTGTSIPILTNSSNLPVGAIAQSATSQSRVVSFCTSLGTLTTSDATLVGRLVNWLSANTDWLNLGTSSGTLASNGSISLSLGINTGSLYAGDYFADINIKHSLSSTATIVPVHLKITADPDIAVPIPILQYPDTFVGYSNRTSFTIKNEGKAPLTISAISLPHGDLAMVTALPLVIAPMSSQSIVVEFKPTSAFQLSGNAVISSNDPDTPTVNVQVSGKALNPPVIAASKEAINLSCASGTKISVPYTIGNTGGSNLTWTTTLSGSAGDSTLDALLATLDQNAASISNLIPNKFSFSEGVTGNSISDGGSDMYDGGNYLNSGLSTSFLNYSDGVISSNSTILGTSGRYFTRKYDGLFVFIADTDSINTFTISGNLGADGSGQADGAEFTVLNNGTVWKAFLKRVYNTGDPSINHLIIVDSGVGVSQTYSSDTDNDDHTISGLSGKRRIYYLLYAGTSGQYIDNTSTLKILNAFLDNIHSTPSWISSSSSSGVTAPAQTSTIDITADASQLYAGNYQAALNITSNDPITPSYSVPINFTVTGQPEITVDPQVLVMPNTIVGSTGTSYFTVSNSGTDTLTLSGITLPAKFSSPQTFPVTIKPGESLQLPVRYTPTTTTLDLGTVTITSNASNEPNYTATIYGIGVPPPIASLNRSRLDVSLGLPANRTDSLRLSNSGKSVLHWNAAIDYGQASPAYTNLNLSGLKIGALSYTPTYYSTFASKLTSMGASVQQLTTSSFDPAVLSSLDVLILDSDASSLPAAQIQAIRTWAQNGGGLLVAATLSSPSNINTLIQGSGIQLTDYNYRSLTTVTDIHYDITTIGVSSLNLNYYAYNNLILSGNAKSLAEQGSLSYGASGSLGSNRTIVVCQNIASSAYNAANLRFLTNVIGWIGGRVSDWVIPVPSSGAVGLNTSANLNFAFDSSNLVPGVYRADAVITTDDPSNSEIRIPLTLTVTNTPQITPDKTSLTYDPTVVGLSSSAQTITLTNSGQGMLTISSVSMPADYSTTTAFPVTLEPGRSVNLPVTFTPTTTGNRNGNLIIRSNAVTSPELAIPLVGYGLAVPSLTLSKNEINVAGTANSTLSSNLTISNTGNGALSWSIRDLYNNTNPVQFPPSLTGVKIGMLTYSTYYSAMRTKLTGYGAALTNLASPLTQAALAPFHVLLVDDYYYGTLTTADYTLIRTWVNSGGSLMVTSSNSYVHNLFNAGSGITPVSNSSNSSYAATTPSDHPINSGVSVVNCYSPYLGFTISGNAVKLLSYANGVVYAACAPIGKGFILSTANTILDTNNFTTGDGERFATQSITWLANRVRWLTPSASSGSTPPTGMDLLTFSFDTTGLSAGNYQASLILQSNDPVKTSTTIPITLLVSANADAAGYAQWRFDNIGGLSKPRGAFSEDANGNGLANGLEYYFKLDPKKSSDRGNLPGMLNSGNQMIYRYTRLTSLSDSYMTIRHSTDLRNWTNISSAGLGQTVSTRDNGNGTTTVEIRFTPGTRSKGFFSFDLSEP